LIAATALQLCEASKGRNDYDLSTIFGYNTPGERDQASPGRKRWWTTMILSRCNHWNIRFVEPCVKPLAYALILLRQDG